MERGNAAFRRWYTEDAYKKPSKPLGTAGSFLICGKVANVPVPRFDAGHLTLAQLKERGDKVRVNLETAFTRHHDLMSESYNMVRSLVDEDNSTGLRKAAREQWLERLRVICEGGKKTVVGVECVPPTLAGELATPTGNDHPPGALSAGELEVLKCIAEGYSTKETAVRLGIAFKTAACHRSNIMDKLGTH